MSDGEHYKDCCTAWRIVRRRRRESNNTGCMLNIGIIGLGPDWETRHRPALARLSQRIRVVAVYDAVAPRALRVAQDLRAVAAPGIRAVMARSDVRALLVLDAAWHGLAPLRMGVEHGKPLYVAMPVAAPPKALSELCRLAATESVLIASELRLRTAPATTRIQELIATQLGSVNHIRAAVAIPRSADQVHSIVAAIDWSSMLFRSIPAGIEVEDRDDKGLRLRITFRRPARNGAPAQAVLDIRIEEEESDLAAVIDCDRGEIRLTGQAQLTWQSGDQAVAESLESERGDVETLFDHFARRVVGGLVPVPGLDDVCRLMELVAPHQDRLAAALR